jgi:hypothetical protein
MSTALTPHVYGSESCGTSITSESDDSPGSAPHNFFPSEHTLNYGLQVASKFMGAGKAVDKGPAPPPAWLDKLPTSKRLLLDANVEAKLKEQKKARNELSKGARMGGPNRLMLEQPRVLMLEGIEASQGAVTARVLAGGSNGGGGGGGGSGSGGSNSNCNRNRKKKKKGEPRGSKKAQKREASARARADEDQRRMERKWRKMNGM